MDHGLLGSTGPTGPKGNAGIPGSVGDIGPTGPQGDQGLQGSQGPAGAQGPDGQPLFVGDVITITNASDYSNVVLIDAEGQYEKTTNYPALTNILPHPMMTTPHQITSILGADPAKRYFAGKNKYIGDSYSVSGARICSA